MTDIPLTQLEKYSVQDLPDVAEGHGDSFWYTTQARGDYLPVWGTRARERALRTYYRHEFNWMGQSAFGGLIKKVKSAPWEIKGKRRVTYFQQVLRQADFGRGWGSLISKVLLDYLRQDGGGFIEVIAPGNPLKAPTAPATGLAYLDSLRCLPTGDPEYPVVYYSRKGTLHIMHRSRVIQLVDQPDGDETQPGYGLCALSRAISIVAQQIHMGRYITQQLDDKPKPGIMVASNMTRPQVMQAFSDFQAESQRDELPPWGRTVIVSSTDPTAPAKLDYVTFSQPPAGWSYKEYTDLHVNAWALALGVDVQELWQLSGGNIGSAQQSQILHAKSQGKTFGDIMTSLERAINDVLPETLEFAFKRHDPYEAQERAQTAQMWASFTQTVGDTMTADEKRRLLANMVEAAADAITDEHGEVIRMDDVSDEPPEEQVASDATPQDASPTEPAAPAEQQTADSQKEIQATRLQFELGFEDLMTARKDLTERSLAARVRSLVRQYGYLAYQDGLEGGGVTDGVLDDDDEAEFMTMLAAQNAYVADFAKSAADLSDAEAAIKPAMWFNKSISPFFDVGRNSADKNGVYEFAGDDGEESCTTCQRLKGQRHRMKDWTRKQLRPGVDTTNYECGGWNCQHKLARTTERARGRF
jgi:hypothetical protein